VTFLPDKAGQGTALNKKVAAFARFTRYGEHGAERRAGNLWTLEEMAVSTGAAEIEQLQS
jgi:hypothetical protein